MVGYFFADGKCAQGEIIAEKDGEPPIISSKHLSRP